VGIGNRVKPNSPPRKELREQLRVAAAAQKLAIKRFRQVIRDIPSGLPHPDGSDRIRIASRELSEAHNLVIALLVELDKISLDGGNEQRP
jgi:hypothetical protein